MEQLDAPFPYWGGKRKVAGEVWTRFGKLDTYVEPFFGSGVVLLRRPQPFTGTETVNDLDGYIANFYRAIRLAPEETARWADSPVNENDLHACHYWLLKQHDSLAERLEGDPEWCDPKIAGWWCWGMCCWIGSGFCSGQGPWRAIDGKLVNTREPQGGVSRKLSHLGDNGRGIKRQRPHLGGGGAHGKGTGQGMVAHSADIYTWFTGLSARLKRVRVCCGDWSRVCGPSVTFKHGIAGVFLDPPYSAEANRNNALYRCESATVAQDVCAWAIEAGKRKDMRIALCGYDGEHDMPPEWSIYEWNAGAGLGGQAAERTNNGKRERIYFSPHCLSAKQGRLF